MVIPDIPWLVCSDFQSEWNNSLTLCTLIPYIQRWAYLQGFVGQEQKLFM